MKPNDELCSNEKHTTITALVMIFFNLLFSISFFHLFDVECSRSLVNPINKPKKLMNMVSFKGFRTLSPKSSTSFSKHLIKLSVMGAGGFVTLSLYTSPPIMNDYNIKSPKTSDPDLPDSNGRTPIFNAILSDDQDTFISQIESGANLNLRDNFGVTLMELAIKKGSMIYFSTLMKSDVNLKQLDSRNRPYIYTTIYDQKFFFARQIIKKIQFIYEDDDLLKELIYLSCLKYDSRDLELRNRTSQIPLIIDLYLLSNCDREILIQVLKSIHPDQIDQSVKLTIQFLINNFTLFLLCPYIPLSEDYREMFGLNLLTRFYESYKQILQDKVFENSSKLNLKCNLS